MDFRLETDTILCIKSSASPVITRQRAGDRRGKHRQPLVLLIQWFGQIKNYTFGRNLMILLWKFGENRLWTKNHPRQK